MSRLTSIADLANGDILPESWVDAARVNMNYVAVGGADLASAATLTITASFHKVTGTANCDTITDALGQVAGQVVTLAFQGAATVRHNGGGTGNIRTRSGLSHVCVAGELMTLVYDGNNWYQQSTQVMQNVGGDSVFPKGIVLNGGVTLQGGIALTGGGMELDYVQITAPVAINGAGAADVTVMTSNAVTTDGTQKIWVEIDLAYVNPSFNYADSITLSLWEGATQLGIFTTVFAEYYTAGGVDAAHNISLAVPVHRGFRIQPTAAAHTYTLKAHRLGGAYDSQSVGAGTGVGNAIQPSWMRILRV